MATGLSLPRMAAPAARGVSQTRACLSDARLAMEGLRSDWTELASEASEPNCYAEHWFVAASLASLDPGMDVRLAEVRSGQTLIGIMPIIVDRGYARLPVRFAQNWCHHHLFLGTPLVRRGHELIFWSQLLDLLDRSGLGTSFLHLRGLGEMGPVHEGLVAACENQNRSCAVVHRERRAWLEAGGSAQNYYARAVRPKKRKELRRQAARLSEMGELAFRRLEAETEIRPWCTEFLELERRGWKGESGTALGCSAATSDFFRSAIQGAWDHGRLDFLRLDLGDRPIAMLVNFLAPPGSFSFKTCFDEEFARFSPGMLIQLENLKVIERGNIDWMDSCAVEGHPMIEGLWTGRRSIVRVTVSLKGTGRRMIHLACRGLEEGAARVRTFARGRSS